MLLYRQESEEGFTTSHCSLGTNNSMITQSRSSLKTDIESELMFDLELEGT